MVDIQKDRIEVEVVAWGRGKESWSVDYQVLEGQTAEPPVWRKLTTLLETHYPTESGAALPIVKFAIDSGYATPEVYAWAREFGVDRAVVIKGDSRGAAPVNQPSPVEVGPLGTQIRWGLRVWPVNGSMIKEELYRWLGLTRPTEDSGVSHPPGYCHFPKYGEEYFKQLTAEQFVTRIVKGYRRGEWQKLEIATKPWTVVFTLVLPPLYLGSISVPMPTGIGFAQVWPSESAKPRIPPQRLLDRVLNDHESFLVDTLWIQVIDSLLKTLRIAA